MSWLAETVMRRVRPGTSSVPAQLRRHTISKCRSSRLIHALHRRQVEEVGAAAEVAADRDPRLAGNGRHRRRSGVPGKIGHAEVPWSPYRRRESPRPVPHLRTGTRVVLRSPRRMMAHCSPRSQTVRGTLSHPSTSSDKEQHRRQELLAAFSFFLRCRGGTDRAPTHPEPDRAQGSDPRLR